MLVRRFFIALILFAATLGAAVMLPIFIFIAWLGQEEFSVRDSVRGWFGMCAGALRDGKL